MEVKKLFETDAPYDVHVRIAQLENSDLPVKNVSDQWLWPVHDNGGWTGPIKDWNESHVHKYFKHVKKFDTVVTAGASCGLYTRMYSHLFKTVYAFEPSWLPFYCMSVNNFKPNVRKFNCALGEKEEILHMSINNISNIGTHRVVDSPNSSEHGFFEIQSMSIDGLSLNSLDFLQLDIEGHEYYALKGGLKTIEKFSPVIVLEAPKKHVYDLLETIGYRHVDSSSADVIMIR